MNDDARDKLLQHEYDGILEYDNPTPGWWYLIFLGTFLYGLWYFPYYHLSSISTSVAEGYQEARAGDLKLRFAEIGELAPTEETLLRMMGSAQWLEVGASVYKAQCVSCHAQDGSGLVGPNLTDDYFKNVKTLADLPKVVADGAANGAMPSWKSRLHPNEVVLVSAFVANLRGRNLPSKRGNEGDLAAPWPQAAPATETPPRPK